MTAEHIHRCTCPPDAPGCYCSDGCEGECWSPASIVFIGHRALTYYQPGKGVYHLPAERHYRTRTYCGITIWDKDQRESPVVPIRRDTAARIARLCGRCAVRQR